MTHLRRGFPARYAAIAALAGLVSACSSTDSGEGAGSTLRNMLLYGGTTVPPVAAKPAVEAADCPPVTVAEGGAALRTVGGGSTDAEAVRTQISIANVARECIERPDGATIVKVGVEGRALLGPGGSANRFDVPLRIVLKSGDRVLVTRLARTSVSIPPGRYEQTFVMVESDLVVPPGTGDFDIEIGLGAGGKPAASAGPRKRRRS